MYLTRLFPKASLVLKLSPLFGTNRRKTQETKFALRKAKTIRPFPSSPGLCFKTRVGAQPLIWKSFFILMQIKLIFTRKFVHLASFWKWGFLELGSGLFTNFTLPIIHCFTLKNFAEALFSISLRTTAVPWRNWKQNLFWKIWRGRRKQGVSWAMWKQWIR